MTVKNTKKQPNVIKTEKIANVLMTVVKDFSRTKIMENVKNVIKNARLVQVALTVVFTLAQKDHSITTRNV